jgi:hypothetical protein
MLLIIGPGDDFVQCFGSLFLDNPSENDCNRNKEQYMDVVSKPVSQKTDHPRVHQNSYDEIDQIAHDLSEV